MSKKNRQTLTPILDNLESSFNQWWKNLKKFVLVYLWGVLFSLVALAVVAIVFSLDWYFGNRSNIVFHALTLVVVICGFLLAFYFSVRAYIGMFLLIKKDYVGDELEIFKETGKYFWPYLGLAFLTAVLVLLWCFLLIVPGIIYSVFYSFAVYIFFFEGYKGWEAIRRSRSLVSGYWWPVFWRFIAIGLAVWMIMMLASWPLSLFKENSLAFHAWNAVLQVFSFVISPIALLYNYHVYQDLLKIKNNETKD